MNTLRLPPLLIVLMSLTATAGDEPGASPDPAVQMAIRKVKVVREAERIVVAEVLEVHRSPGIWCGILATRQEVTYRVLESVYGGAARGEVRVGHLLVGGTALVSADAPFLRPSIFYPGARFLLCLHRDGEKWAVRDESFGAVPIDPAKKADPVKTELLRQVLLLPELREYFHPEEKGRVPVKVVLTEAVPVARDLSIFGERVHFAPAYLLQGDPHLKITRIVVEDQRAEIHFAYDVEGVIGEARFVRENGRYRLASSKVAER